MNTRANLRILGLVVWMSATAPTWATDICVDAGSPGANNGTSWLNAYHYLQDALAAAQPGDTIKVAQGVYKPNQATGLVTSGRSATFAMQSGVSILGGFAGYGAAPSWPSDDRDPCAYRTVLSGDLSGNDASVDPNDQTAIELLLTVSGRQDNCYNVVTANYTDPTAILDGFTIIGGTANGTTATRGGGIVCYQGSPTIRNCRIESCVAADTGGGMYNSQGDPNVAHCTFMANYAAQFGGAMYNLSADPNVLQCTFEHNRVEHHQGKGGGIYNNQGNPLLANCSFKGNYGGSSGGAVYNVQSDPNIVGCTFRENATHLTAGAIRNDAGSHSRISNCLFVGNSATNQGGAIENWQSVPRLVACTFIGNQGRQGGAIYNYDSDPNVINCLFNGNEADDYGGGMTCFQSRAVVVNCTFSANTSAGGQAVACYSTQPPATSSRLTIVNSILWDQASELYNNDSSQITVTYSVVYGFWPGTGNRSANPMFVDQDGPDMVLGNEDDNLRLSQQSECIDAGNNNAVPDDIRRDLTGKTRFINDPNTADTGKGQPPLVDMGAYEFGTDVQGLHPPVANAGPDQTAHATSGGYASVALDGSGSYDPDGSSLQYSWTWTAGAQTYHATGVKPTLQLPVGQHVIQLIVFDGGLYSDPDTVQITVLQAGGLPPVANAGPDQTASAPAGGYATVTLDGSSSYDPEGSSLQYLWTWSIGAQTYHTTGVKPTLQLPVGQHVIQLTVNDGTSSSYPDSVKITVLQTGGLAPVANAGPDQTASAPAGGYATVTLDGSSSYDPEGSPLQYSWTWTIGTLTYHSTAAQPTIQLPVGVRVVQLVVYDGNLYSSPDTVQITVLQAGGLPPVANAGPDKTVYAPAGGHATVTLDGSGSHDPEGSPLQYSWTWTIGTLTYHSTAVKPTIQFAVGQYAIQLIVFDGTYYSNPDTVQITVLQTGGLAPVANAGTDKTVYASAGGYASVTLDGSGSYDPEGSSLQYSWTWTIGSLTYHATGVKPTLQLPVGVRIVQLVVYDGNLYSNPDTVQITVIQAGGLAPVANAGPDQTAYALPGQYASVTLDGSASYDPEGSPLQYSWTWTIGTETFDATGVGPAIQLPVGQHPIELTVFDGTSYSTPDQMLVTVVEPQAYTLHLWPYHVNLQDSSTYLLVLMVLPEIGADQIDLATPLTIYPGQVQAFLQHATEQTDGGVRTMLIAMFHEQDLLNAIPQDGVVTLTVEGRLLSGEPFSGTGTVRLTH